MEYNVIYYIKTPVYSFVEAESESDAEQKVRDMFAQHVTLNNIESNASHDIVPEWTGDGKHDVGLEPASIVEIVNINEWEECEMIVDVKGKLTVDFNLYEEDKQVFDALRSGKVGELSIEIEGENYFHLSIPLEKVAIFTDENFDGCMDEWHGNVKLICEEVTTTTKALSKEDALEYMNHFNSGDFGIERLHVSLDKMVHVLDVYSNIAWGDAKVNIEHNRDDELLIDTTNLQLI